MEIPKIVSGRPVTNRGVHLHASGYHAFWCGDRTRREYVLDMLVAMHMSWVVILTDGGSALEKFDGKAPVEWLLERGIIPIVRDYAILPRRFNNMGTVEGLANIYDRFGAPLLLKLWNEPQDDREWNSGTPSDWWEKFVDRWNAAAPIVLRCGGYPGFPDGPGYDFDRAHPFRDTERYLWDDGLAWYGVHNYAKGRPIDYPYDEVSQRGQALTQAERDLLLDDFADDPRWTDPPLDEVNQKRRELTHTGKTILDDDTCWLAYEKVQHHALTTLGHEVQIATVEGGWVPRDRAGTGLDIDCRWPHTTPKKVAEWTLDSHTFSEELFAICPWMLAGKYLGQGGWPFDEWWGWAYSDMYGTEKPVIQMLKDNPPMGVTPPLVDWSRITGLVEEIQNVCFGV